MHLATDEYAMPLVATVTFAAANDGQQTEELLNALVIKPPPADVPVAQPDPRDLPTARADGAYGNAPTRQRAIQAGFRMEAPSRGQAKQPGVGRVRNAVERGHAWLKIDEKTGMLSGRPDMAGKAEVVVTASIEREVRKLDEKALIWGNEKVLFTTLERVGAATQKFIIDVQ